MSTAKKDIKKVLATEKIVVLDEAYSEYTAESITPLIKKYPNLISIFNINLIK